MRRRPPASTPPATRTGPVVVGDAGASAIACYRLLQRRWWRTLGLVLTAATLAAAAVASRYPQLVVWVLIAELALVLATTWRYRSRSARRWLRGALGEQRTAQLLAGLSAQTVVLHDRAVPYSRANIDHLIIAPTGIWVVDTKVLRGRVGLDADGRLRRGDCADPTVLATVAWIAQRVAQTLRTDEAVPVHAVAAVHDATLEDGGGRGANGVLVVAAEQVPVVVGAAAATLSPARVQMLARRSVDRFPPAAGRQPPRRPRGATTNAKR